MTNSWEVAAHAAVITDDLADAALTSMEADRIGYGSDHRRAAERIVRMGLESGRPDLALRAKLILVDISLRSGRLLDAGQLAERVLADANRTGDMFAAARAYFFLSDVHHGLGGSPLARINGIRAVELLPADAPTGVRIDHLRALATAYGPSPECRRPLSEALDLATAIGDVPRAIGIHNGLSYWAFLMGDVAVSAAHAERMLELSRVRGVPLLASQVDTVGRSLMAQGRTEQAVSLLYTLIPVDVSQAHAIVDRDPKPYALPECLLTLADAHASLGRFVSARRALDVAVVMARSRRLGFFQARAIEASARLYAEIGNYRMAYEAHIAYHEALTTLYSDEDEARAQIVEAAFDARETRRDEEGYRDLALRDALTGLYNRRFIDEHLDAAIAAARENASHLSVAIVDADFFKRVNDDLSHAVGDAVLRRLATVLADAALPGETVARLGGEEFVLVLPRTDADAAFERCEAVRRAVAETDWTPLTGTIPVTVSIGVSTLCPDAETPSDLLSHADRNLYAAKRSGRNRVMPDPS